MKQSTAIFLVLLRLAIGWHFLVEGWHKLETHLRGPTESVTGKTRPWSSEGYFREGAGPLARLIRSQVGDPDDEALGRLEPVPLPPGKDPAAYPPKDRVPPLLAAQWQEYLDRFTEHYKLDERQKAEAQVKLDQAKAGVVAWLTNRDVDDKTKAVKKNYQSVTYEVKHSVPERIAEYKKRAQEVRDLVGSRMWRFGKDVEGKRLAQEKADVADLRAALLADLNEEHTAKLQQALNDLLTPEQKKSDPIPDVVPSKVLAWLNLVTAWGLTILGGTLLLGLFTRTSCVLAFLFLTMTYFCTPPWPWLPTPPNNEGFYYFINKNVIEGLALLALATTASGRWFGVDALIHELWLLVRGKRRARPV